MMDSFQPGAAASYWALKAVPGCYTAAGDMWGSAVAAGSLAPVHVPTQKLAASGQNEELLGVGPGVVVWEVA